MLSYKIIQFYPNHFTAWDLSVIKHTSEMKVMSLLLQLVDAQIISPVDLSLLDVKMEKLEFTTQVQSIQHPP